MVDEPDNLVLQYLRRIDAKLDRVVDDLRDIKIRMSSVATGMILMARKLERIDGRLDRVEVRLGCVEV